MPSFFTSLTQIFTPSTSSNSALPSHNNPNRRSHLSVPRQGSGQGGGGGSNLSNNNNNNNLGAYYDDAWDIPSSGPGSQNNNGNGNGSGGKFSEGFGSLQQSHQYPRGRMNQNQNQPQSGLDTEPQSRRTSTYSNSGGQGQGSGYDYTSSAQHPGGMGYNVPGTEGLNSSQIGSNTSRTGAGGGENGSEQSSRESSPHVGPGEGGRGRDRADTIKPRSSTFGLGAGGGGGFAYPPAPAAMMAGGGGGGGGMSYGWGGSGGGRNGTLDPRSSAIMSNRPVRSRTSTQSFFSPNGPLQYYPPLNQTWSRIKSCLLTHLPELHDSLNYPVDPKDLSELEGAVGTMLPPSVRDSYLCVDGQDSSSDCKEGLFFGLTLLPIEDVLREWLFWRQVEHDPQSGMNPEVLSVMSSIPPGWIKRKYACKGWLPLIADQCGNYVGVDLDPGTSEEFEMYRGGGGGEREQAGVANANPPASTSSQNTAGTWGQVIVFGREFDRKCVLWRGEGEGGWGRWLAGFAEELESGEGWEIDGASDRRGSDGEEDDIGYSSYYFEPSSGTNGGAGGAYGEGGSGLRLTGEYRGWSVLEAWWDRSVRKWDELGLSVTPMDLRREEEYRLRKAKGKQREGMPVVQGLGFGGMRLGGAGEDVEVPIPVMEEQDTVISSIPILHAPATPGPETALLAPHSPSTSSEPFEMSPARKNLEKLQIPDTPTTDSQPRLITPYSPSIPTIEAEQPSPTHPLQQQGTPFSVGGGGGSSASRRESREEGLLSPPSFSPPKLSNKRSSLSSNNPPPPAPGALDLPTRADVQAAQAVATAEQNGLRGGWVMSMEAVGTNPSSLAGRRDLGTTSGSSTAANGSMAASSKAPLAAIGQGGVGGGSRRSEDVNDMEDIDLEGGKRHRFGSSSASRGMNESQSQQADQSNIRSSPLSNRGTGGSRGMRTPSPNSSQGQHRDSTDYPVDMDTETPKFSAMKRMSSTYSPESAGPSGGGGGQPLNLPTAGSGSAARHLDLGPPVVPATLKNPHQTLSTAMNDANDEFSDVNLGSSSGGVDGQGERQGQIKPGGGKRNSAIMDKLAKAGLAV